ncbi:MAG: 16S rRNA methyltransferase [Candidatus Verstraetearchaeota archaeon]|nr:16S rRNA methyltransferase [Candidatus Verstraetearchaeota archaeon]
MINIVLAESALETVPREIADHPSVKRLAERRGKDPTSTLLDISYHYAAMKDLEDWDRRGRPDITYVTLLTLLESPLNREGRLSIYVHTVRDFIISVDPKVKLPRNYTRFEGLMEQLFEVFKVPPKGKPLMTLKRGTLKDLIRVVAPSRTFFLTEEGKRTKVEAFANKAVKEDRPLVVIGGFQRGEFSDENLRLADERVSVYKEPLDAWVVAGIIAHELERALGIL